MTVHQSLQAPEQAHFPREPIRSAISKQTIRLFLYAELLVIELAVILGTPLLLGHLSTSLDLRFDILPTLALIPIYGLMAVNSGAYSLEALRRPLEYLRRAVTSMIMAQLSVLMVIFFLKSSEEVSRLSFGIGSAATIVTIALARAVFARHVRHLTKGQLVNELVLIDGVQPTIPLEGVQVAYASQLRLTPDLNDPQMLNRFGLLAKHFDRIVVASVPERQVGWALLLKGADIDGEILMEEANAVGAIGLRSFGDRETMLVSRKPLSLTNRAKKRALDLAITVPLLIAMLPLLAIVALAIKLDSAGPVLFKQERVGRGNRLFKVLKFRSMRADLCDAKGNRSASRDDDRITRVGHFIRATSIDELPQLFNVLLGDMSLVGPRPHALGSLAGKHLFWEVDQTYWHRHQLKPGITGLAQIRGHRGATLKMSDLTDRLQADMEYVQGWGIWRDISILLNTFRVLVHKNAF